VALLARCHTAEISSGGCIPIRNATPGVRGVPMKSPIIDKLLNATIDWEKSRDIAFVFVAVFEGTSLRLRLNDFPDEPVCTIFFGTEKMDLEDIPRSWTLPAHGLSSGGSQSQ
jgi:hypothetical protein